MIKTARIRPPSSTRQAKQWLQATSYYLLALPHAANHIRFVAEGLRRYVNQECDLYAALGLRERRARKKEFSQSSVAKDRAIATMLKDGRSVMEIMGKVDVSKSYVESIKAKLKTEMLKSGG
ncbi:hypothetical protein W02_20820 [Nitrospira sp. KM1]|uniref:hypothetical protein n=1 Tax=Nitrospira sp. KM1 TaxID=1936990 RepID=UPI0013A70D04|nr:hypothetical protein [Nitrospira sp. KM1]BCA54942.1 hypothetical protein W02_20820 [Nitrospira sp. KM1]